MSHFITTLLSKIQSGDTHAVTGLGPIVSFWRRARLARNHFAGRSRLARAVEAGREVGQVSGESTSAGYRESQERSRNVVQQPSPLAIRLGGVTATCEKRSGHACYLLRSLSNTRPQPTTVEVRLLNKQVKRFALLPFQKLVVYPPLAVTASSPFSQVGRRVITPDGDARGYDNAAYRY
jgi:hypothetical protein